jgi:hypothetical protein
MGFQFAAAHAGVAGNARPGGKPGVLALARS